jgi:hypothetical protein
MTHDLTIFVGDFNPTPVFRMGDAGDVYTINAYLDENANGTRDAAEFQLTLTINVIDFGSALVHAGRVAGGVLYPGEDLLFIKPEEIFDITSTFEYKLAWGPDTVLGPSALIRGQLIRPSAGTVIGNSGATGDSFTVMLTSAMAGPAQVRFYADANFNGVCDIGEIYRMSNVFNIVERNHLTRTYQYSLFLSGLTQASIQADVDSSMALALCKDSDEDWRAAVYTTVTPAADHFFAPSATRPDPADSRAKISLHLHALDGMTLLTAMSDPHDGGILGMAYTPGTSLVVDWDSKGVDVVVHELGHNLGLIHNGLGGKYIMEAVIYGSNDHLTFAEAATYSGASTPTPSPGPDAKLESTFSPVAVRISQAVHLDVSTAVARFTIRLPRFAAFVCCFDMASIQSPCIDFRSPRLVAPRDWSKPAFATHETSEPSHFGNQIDAMLQGGVLKLDLTPIQDRTAMHLLGVSWPCGTESC